MSHDEEQQPEITAEQLLKALAAARSTNKENPLSLEEIVSALGVQDADRKHLQGQLEQNTEYQAAMTVTDALFLTDEYGKLDVPKTVRRIRTVVRKGAIVASKVALTFEDVFTAQEPLVLRHFLQRNIALYDGADQFGNNWETLRIDNEILFNALYWAAEYAPELLPQAILTDEDELGDFLDQVFSDNPKNRKIAAILTQFAAKGKSRVLDVYWHDEAATPQQARVSPSAAPVVQKRKTPHPVVIQSQSLRNGVLPEFQELARMAQANDHQGVFTLLYDRGQFFRSADLSSRYYFERMPLEVMCLVRAGTAAYPFASYMRILQQEYGMHPLLPYLADDRDQFITAVRAHLPQMADWVEEIALDARFSGRDGARPWPWRNSGQYSWSGVEIRP